MLNFRQYEGKYTLHSKISGIYCNNLVNIICLQIRQKAKFCLYATRFLS